MNCLPRVGGVSVTRMADSMLQRQLDELRSLLARARELFGSNPVAPPRDIGSLADERLAR